MLYLDLDMISSFRYYIKKEILYIDLTVVPYCSKVTQTTLDLKWMTKFYDSFYNPTPILEKSEKKCFQMSCAVV